MAQALLLVETIDGKQFERLYTGEATPEQIAEEMDILTEKRKAQAEADAKAYEEEEESRDWFNDEIPEDEKEDFKTFDEVNNEENESGN